MMVGKHLDPPLHLRAGMLRTALLLSLRQFKKRPSWGKTVIKIFFLVDVNHTLPEAGLRIAAR